ncbi:MAG: hypothetical protein P1V51_16315 [Deltaproteobacteria bacterium]|nr:hypothetical protein [Deltaproteobacteria bacterium]
MSSPRRTLLALLALVVLAGLGGCPGGDPEGSSADAAGDQDGGVSDAGPGDGGERDGGADAGPSCDPLAAACVSDVADFGTLFTRSNGRADGTLLAMVRPGDTGCALYNNDHAVLQLSIQGHIQRLVVALDGVGVHAIAAPLVGPPYQEGWHENVTVDYPGDLGVHAADFESVTMDGAVAFLCAALTEGAPVSVFAYCDGAYPSSAHQIHRNDNYPDGAIVVAPDSGDPTWLLFRYDGQQF